MRSLFLSLKSPNRTVLHRPHRRRDGASAGHPGIPGGAVRPAAGAYPAGGA